MESKEHQNITLPKCVHKKGPSYYRVKNNVWMRLGSTIEEAMACNQQIEETGHEGASWWKFGDIDKHYDSIYANARRNARNRGREFILSRDDFKIITKRCNYRCEISGIPFTLEKVGGPVKRPFAPSLDRVDSSGPYALDNCRIVLWAINAGMQDWGLTVYLAIAEQALKRSKELENSLELRSRRSKIISNIARMKT